MKTLSVIILTRDEELHLPRALASIVGVNADVFVVDSGSTDRTVELARAGGCHVTTHAFTTHAEQLNWALDHLPIMTEWVMRLDADERLTPELAAELATTLPSTDAVITGFQVRRRIHFWRQWIRRGGLYPNWVFRVWRRGTARCELRLMDEHMVSSAGRIGRLKNDIIDENLKPLRFFIDKHNRYSDRERLDVDHGATSGRLAAPAARKRWLKRNMYGRSPLFLRAFAYWLFRYVVQLGFLDGKAGFVFHFLHALWYRFLVDAKIAEANLRDEPGAPRSDSVGPRDAAEPGSTFRG